MRHSNYIPFYFFVLLLVGFPSKKLFSQVGGQHSFEFLHIPTNARLVGLGGINVSNYQNDVAMFMANPSLLTDSTDLHLALNYYALYAGIQQSSLAFSNSFKKWGTWAVGIQYLNYGNFEGFDITGLPTNDFNANEYMLTIAHAHQVGNFSLGGNLKFASSTIELYQANALLFDFGGAFFHPQQDLVVGFAFKNIGFALSNYVEGQTFDMPLDIQVGVTFKPKRMPLRLSVTAHHVQRFDIAYQDPNDESQVDLFGQTVEQEISFADKLARHFIIGGEFVLSKHLNFRMGYNFLQRRELLLENRKGITGFSFGAMARFNKFELAYANTTQHIVGGTHNVSLTVFTNQFVNKKKRIIE